VREWRQELQEGTSPRVRVLLRYRWTCAFADALGAPVLLQREGVADPGGLARELGWEVLLVHFCAELEDALELARERMLQRGSCVPPSSRFTTWGTTGSCRAGRAGPWPRSPAQGPGTRCTPSA
ncbi:unnamed protein product, partial [Prorocentrum cordatum]